MTRRDSALIRQLSRPRIEAEVRYLATHWPTRHTLSKHHDDIVAYLQRRIAEIGGFVPGTHTYPMAGKTRTNVVGTLKARNPDAPTTLICAHFDSRQQDIGNAEAPAPGANDNGTGVAIVLELMRVLRANPNPARDTLRFVLFSGEEQGLVGSRAYASDPKNRAGLRFVLNIDQVGFPPPDRALFIDRDEAGKPQNNAKSVAIAETMARLAKDDLKLLTRFDPVEGSDYVPFESQGEVVVGLYEAGKNYPQYHRDTDTPERVDFAYVHDMARLALATVLDVARER